MDIVHIACFIFNIIMSDFTQHVLTASDEQTGRIESRNILHCT